MNRHDAERNIFLYKLHAIFNEPLFWGPILIASLEKLAHMSLPDIYYMESVVLCICVLLDIPSGALADVIGRKRSVVIGRGFLFGSAFFFTIMEAPIHAWIGNILWAIGYTMQSGADTALLYDTLKEHGREAEFKRVEGQAIGLRLILVACCSLITGVLAGVDWRLPLWLCLPFVAIPFFGGLLFKEPIQTEHYSVHKQIGILKEGVGFAIRSVTVRWMIGFAALLATTSKVWFFTYNPYFELVALSVTYYGVIFFCLNVVAWLSSHYAYKVEEWIGERVCIIVMILCIGIPILLMASFPIPPFAYLVIVQNIVRGFMRPFVGDYLNRHITSSIRATVLSVQSSVANLMAIMGLAVFGFLTGTLGLLYALLMLGVTATGLGLLSYVTYVKKIR